MSIELITTLPAFNTPEQHRKLVSSAPKPLEVIQPVLRRKESAVRVTFDPPVQNQLSWTPGTLYVIDSCLAFKQDESDKGFRIEYPSIAIHAVRGHAVYCQLQDGTLSDDEYRELRIEPKSMESVSAIIEALSFCASLHVDQPSDLFEEESSAGSTFGKFEVFEGNEEEELTQVGKAALQYLDSIKSP